jgi:dTDP-4-dehydrorhamnose 3,5-epimerase
MKFSETPLAGAYVIELEPFLDERGLFVRTFCQQEFAQIGFDKKIVQINHSLTRQKGTIRGLHYQRPPACEIKIIRCIQGAVFDVLVDLRAGSPTFLKWHGVELSEKNMKMVYIPERFAHGFQTLTDNTELIYHHSTFQSPVHESGLKWDDPSVSIQWPAPASVISAKDQKYPIIDKRFKGIQ